MVVATHYYNPDDEREIKGINDPNKLQEIYERPLDEESPNKENNPDGEAPLTDRGEGNKGN